MEKVEYQAQTSSVESQHEEIIEPELKEAAGLPTDWVPATPEEETAVIRKLDWHLLPFVFLLYMLAVLDRSNLGNARLAGLEKSIDLKGNHYQWLGTIFYIAYICSQWLLIGWKRFPPHIYCAIAVFFWGFVATIQATVSSWAGLMACRFFLGVSEAMCKFFTSQSP